VGLQFEIHKGSMKVTFSSVRARQIGFVKAKCLVLGRIFELLLKARSLKFSYLLLTVFFVVRANFGTLDYTQICNLAVCDACNGHSP